MICYGVDVSKETLDIACCGKVQRIANNSKSISKWIKSVPRGSKIAMESTNIYHRVLADTCYKSGMDAYVINPRMTHHYREALGFRGHNDRMDAKSIASYLEHHNGELRIYEPLSSNHERLLTLMRRRKKIVDIKTLVCASLGNIKEIKRELKSVVDRLKRIICRLDEMIEEELKGNEDRANIQSIKGVGSVVSAKLYVDLDARRFASGDSFVAFYGLDCGANDSGKCKGTRKLSKRGDRLGRSLLYSAAMAAVKSDVWKPLYEKDLAAGWKKVQALVIIARKIARIAWSIYTHKTRFDPSLVCVGLRAEC